jgi:hypothetical protein
MKKNGSKKGFKQEKKLSARAELAQFKGAISGYLETKDKKTNSDMNSMDCAIYTIVEILEKAKILQMEEFEEKSKINRSNLAIKSMLNHDKSLMLKNEDGSFDVKSDRIATILLDTMDKLKLEREELNIYLLKLDDFDNKETEILEILDKKIKKLIKEEEESDKEEKEVEDSESAPT